MQLLMQSPPSAPGFLQSLFVPRSEYCCRTFALRSHPSGSLSDTP